MESLKNYLKAIIIKNKKELKEKYENKEVNVNETIVMVKLLNVLKAEANMLDNENLSEKNKNERAVVIENLAYIVTNYKELDPLINKYYLEKKYKEKWESEER